MQMSPVKGTCSMSELYEVYRSDLDYSKKEFMSKMEELAGGTRGCALTKVILLNTNWNYVERLVLRWKFGFTEGPSYKGNNGKVTSMFLKLK